MYVRFNHEKGNPFRHRTEYPCDTLPEAVEALARHLKTWAEAFPEVPDSASALEASDRVRESGNAGTWDVGSTTYGIEERTVTPPEGKPAGGYDLPPFGRVEFVPNVRFLAGTPGYVTTEPGGHRQWHSDCTDAERWLEQRGKLHGIGLRYFTLVRGPRGRTWYRADSGLSADRDFVATEVARLREKYPDLSFEVGDSLTEYEVAPLKYRPWAEHIEGK